MISYLFYLLELFLYIIDNNKLSFVYQYITLYLVILKFSSRLISNQMTYHWMMDFTTIFFLILVR